MPLLDSALVTVRAFPNAAKELIHNAGEDLVDALAEVYAAERGANAERRLGQAEIQNKDTGTTHVVKVGRTATRSFNTPRLITRFADVQGVSPLAALTYLVQLDVVRINWQWTKLKDLMSELEMAVTVQPSEIVHGDDADVGEVWKDTAPQYNKVTTVK